MHFSHQQNWKHLADIAFKDTGTNAEGTFLKKLSRFSLLITHRANFPTNIRLSYQSPQQITELWLLDRVVDLFGKLN